MKHKPTQDGIHSIKEVKGKLISGFELLFMKYGYERLQRKKVRKIKVCSCGVKS